MAIAVPPPNRPSSLYVVATALGLLCCGPLGLIVLWLGPFSSRAKVVITVVWLVTLGPAALYYWGGGFGNPGAVATPTPT